MTKPPFVLGWFSDQAPRYYPKAVEVQFLNQKTYVVSGPGLLYAQENLTPVWGWTRRVGRSQYEFGLEEMKPELLLEGLAPNEWEQISHISEQHGLTREKATQVYLVTKDFSQRLEAQIKMAPQDWLWSHRRWKTR